MTKGNMNNVILHAGKSLKEYHDVQWDRHIRIGEVVKGFFWCDSSRSFIKVPVDLNGYNDVKTTVNVDVEVDVNSVRPMTDQTSGNE